MFEKRLENVEKIHETEEKVRYLRYLLKNMKTLEHRSTCPVCNHEVEHVTEEEIIMVTKIFDLAVTQMVKEKKEYEAEMKPIWDVDKQKRKEFREQALEYRMKNRNKLNKTIRTLTLPNIPNDEKKLWNEAMEIQVDKRNILENDEFLFEV